LGAKVNKEVEKKMWKTVFGVYFFGMKDKGRMVKGFMFKLSLKS